MVVLIGERPEEVTDWVRSVKAEVDASTFRNATQWTPRWPLDAALSRAASPHRTASPY